MDSSILTQYVQAYAGLPKETVQQRFWRNVDKSGDCWVWTGFFSTHGYGRFNIKYKMYTAHRVSWQIRFGDIPEIEGSSSHGTCVLHKCDNPKCVNPDHLFLGTQKDNTDDRDRKGRTNVPKGEYQKDSKLTEKQVRLIRYWWGLGNMSQKRMAKFFNVVPCTISNVITRRTWKHI